MVKLTKLHFSEIKQDICVEDDIISSENHLTFQCSNNQLITLDLLDSSLVLTDLFFNIHYVEIPQINKYSLLEKTDLRDSYKNSAFLHQQRLVLELPCIAQFSCERLKIKVLQFKQSQWNTSKMRPLAVTVTVNGLCRILQKLPAPSRNWSEICSVDEYILDNILSIQNRNHSHNLINELHITSADWHKTEAMLFVSFENGYIAVLAICNSTTVKLDKYFLTKATVGNICSITSFENYLLVSSRCGALQLLSVNYLNDSITLIPLTTLWNRRDDMICRRVLATKFSPSTYLIVFNKGSHILAFMLNLNGKILCSTQLYIGGIKVTGLQFISSSEFIVTNITSTVRFFRVELFDYKEMKLSEEIVEVDLGSPNLGIISFVSSPNCSFLTFILIRNGEYSQHSKYLSNSIFINISKLERVGVLEKLSKPGLDVMNSSQDYLISLSMDLLNAINHDQKKFFSDVMRSQLPETLDNGFLLQLQIKFVLVANFFNVPRLKRKKNEELATTAHRLLFNAIQICHIINRLRHLLSLEFITLSSFQKECINIFIKRYAILVHKLKRCLSRDRLLELTTERYINFFTKSFDVDVYQKTIKWNERCLKCNNLTNPDTMMCDRNHKVKRCYVSYKQLPEISSRHCPRCQCYVLEDEYLLQQLFTPNENITCTFCRFQFVKDCI